MNDFRESMGQVIHFYDSCRHKPRLSKTISIEANLPKPGEEGWVPWCSLDISSESSSPTIHTYLGKWLLSPFSLYSWDPSIAPERWPGPAQRQALFIRKRNICVVRDSSVSNPICIQERWECHFVLENDFLKYCIQSSYKILTHTQQSDPEILVK